MDISELYNILLDDKPSQRIIEQEETIFKMIPELKLCQNFNQHSSWHIYDVYNHILNVIDNTPNDLELRISALFHDLGKPFTFILDQNNVGHFYNHWKVSQDIFLKFAEEYNLDKKMVSTISKLIYYHDIHLEKLTEDKIKDLFTKEEIIKLYKLKRADLLAQNPEYRYLLEDYDKEEYRLLLKYK